MAHTIKEIKKGLRELPEDNRDLSLGAIFKLIDIKEVPDIDFVVATPLAIKDQGDTDLCSAFAVTSVSEDQEGLLLSPEFQFAKTKQIIGDWTGWGADLRSACKAACNPGSIPGILAPFNLTTKMRDYIANWNNWPQELDAKAHKYAKDSFLKITGPYDHFDNMRAMMWQFKDERRSVILGTYWDYPYTNAYKGIIPDVINNDGFGHAFKIFGQKMIEGTPYLVAQLSNGSKIGDNGLFYFPRNVINASVEKFGAFMFKDISPEKLRFYQDNDVKIGESWIKILVARIINFIKKLQ